MTDELNYVIFSTKVYNIFQKYHWHFHENTNDYYHFNYKGEIADYYLLISFNKKSLNFNYTLDIDVSRDKVHELLLLINFVNKKTPNGNFIYDLPVNKVKFKINMQYFPKLNIEIIEDFIEENLHSTNNLFHNFSQAAHNLIYAEKTDQNFMELMFSQIQGNA